MNSFSEIVPYNNFIYLFVLIFSVFTYGKCKGKKVFKSKRDKNFSYVFGFIFVFMYVSGLFLSSGGEYNLRTTIQILIASALLAPSIGIVYNWLNKYLFEFLNKSKRKENILTKHPVIVASTIMIICWLPYFLALYPGLFTYDVSWQLLMALNNAYSTHHPLIHTLYLKLFYLFGESIGSYNVGMACSVIVQIVLTAFSLSYSLDYLIKKGVNHNFIVIALIFFSITPFFPILFVSMTKDILFTACLNFTFILVLKLNDNNFYFDKKIDYLILLVFSILTSVLRNNGKYVIYIVAISIIIRALKKKINIKKSIYLALLVILMVVSMDALIIKTLDSEKGSKNEMMSIPYQQLSRVYNKSLPSLSTEEKATIELLIPNVDNYNPNSADPVKEGKIFGGMEYTIKFPRVYLKLMIKEPAKYMEAILLNTQGYWYLDDVSSSQMYGKNNDGTIGDDYGLFLMDTKGGFGVTHESKFVTFDNLLRSLFHLNNYQNIPIFSCIFSMALYFWIIVDLLFYSIQYKRVKTTIPFVFVLSFMATVFAGPCALFRYALPYIVLMPSLMAYVFNIKPKKN